MAWPPDVVDGVDVIAAAHINSIRDSVRTWPGDVSAAGYKLTNTGDVGIATSTPAARLHVVGAQLVDHSTPYGARPAVGTPRIAGEISACAGGAFSDAGLLRLSGGGGATAGQRSYIDISGYSGDATLDNTIVLGTRSTERMRITAAGNVTIVGASAWPSGGAPTPLVKFQSASGGVHVQWLGGGASNYWGIANAYSNSDDFSILKFDGAATVPVLTLRSSGNAGINSPTPTRRLHVQDVSATQIALQGSSANKVGVTYLIDTSELWHQYVQHDGTYYTMHWDYSGGKQMSLRPNGGLQLYNLPSANPGAGTKQLWYDPADGNRVKFAA